VAFNIRVGSVGDKVFDQHWQLFSLSMPPINCAGKTLTSGYQLTSKLCKWGDLILKDFAAR
jgi:hypothetical protein